MTSDAFDPALALQTLDRHGVRFVVIGGIAARLLGSPTVTRDTDICYERAPENLERLAAALEELGATLRAVDEEVPFPLDAKTSRPAITSPSGPWRETSTSSALLRVSRASTSLCSTRSDSISMGSPSS